MNKSKSNTLIHQSTIDELSNDPTTFVLNNDYDTIINIIQYTNDKYRNDQPVISDEIYDFLIDTIKDIDPENQVLKLIGAKVSSKNKVKLPYFMGSMDKVKPTDQTVLLKWLSKYKGPYIYSDKLDGVSGLLYYSQNKLKLYTRGDGHEGTDISNLIKLIPSLSNLNKKKLSDGMAIRGELIMSRNKFEKYSNKMANARNMVSGIVNSKTVDINITSDIDFVAYEMINPWVPNQLDQWKQLDNFGLKVVEYGYIDVEFDKMSKVLNQRKSDSMYNIDGIIISNNKLNSERTIDANPEYAFAFKDSTLLETANVEVIGVEWSISKDKYIKPVLKLIPTKLSGVTISNVTANNAKFIVDNKLGPGAIIELIRSGDVIPKIQKIIKPAISGEAQLPDIEYTWTKTGVDIIATQGGIDQKVKELTFFFKILNISNLDESTVRKLIDASIDSIPKILLITKNDLSKVEGFKERMTEKIYNNIQDRIKDITILDLMHASNTFGHGIGERKLKKIMSVYPDIIKLYQDYDQDDIINKIKEIDGFDVKTAEYFTIGLDNFIDLFNNLTPDMRKKLRLSIVKYQELDDLKEDNKDNKFLDKTIVFSGFRNKEWEKIIESHGGKIGSAISSNTSLLVTTLKDIEEGTNSKVIKAKNLNIPILTKEQFEDQYIN